MTATDTYGVVHDLAGRDPENPTAMTTLCGQDARGWSTHVTDQQRMGLVIFCPVCAAVNAEQETAS